MKKRMLALALAVVLCLALLPTSALAAALTVPCRYSEAMSFSDDLAAVKDDAGNWSFIDRNGTALLACPYERTRGFSDSCAAVCDASGKWGFMNKAGTLVVPCQFADVHDFHEGYAAVMSDERKWGFINKSGALVVPCKYDDVSDFSGGLAGVVDEDWKMGFINTSGAEVIPLKFWYTMSVYPFKNGIAPVASGETFGDYGNDSGGPVQDAFINTSGALIAREGDEGYEALSNQYWSEYWTTDGCEAFYDAEARAYGLKDAAGNLVIPCEYDYVEEYFDSAQGMVMVRKDGKYGFVDLKAAPPAKLAYPSTQPVEVDGVKVEFQCYALKDANGNDTNYIKLRDLAAILNGSAVQFNVGWDGAVNIETGKGYTPNGSEMKTPFGGNRAYETATAPTNVNGKAVALDAIVLKDDNGGAYTYYKLRDLGAVLGITVDWTAERGIFVETK